MDLPPDLRPIDADNHYYETLDAFTRHLDRDYSWRGVRPVQDGKRVQVLIGGTVNRFVPNPTFDPIIVPGGLDPLSSSVSRPLSAARTGGKLSSESTYRR